LILLPPGTFSGFFPRGLWLTILFKVLSFPEQAVTGSGFSFFICFCFPEVPDFGTSFPPKIFLFFQSSFLQEPRMYFFPFSPFSYPAGGAPFLRIFLNVRSQYVFFFSWATPTLWPVPWYTSRLCLGLSTSFHTFIFFL